MRSEAWRPAAAACNVLPREARDPARQALRPGCEELAARIRVMPETEARPRVKNRHGGAPRGERPALWDARRLARRLACRVMCTPNGCRCTRTFLGAPPTPRCGVGEAKSQNPGADMRRGNDGLFDIVSCRYAMLVLILRSAHTEVLPQTRTRVRASRRMRTGEGARALMLRDASQRGSGVAAPALAARCDAPQHEGRSGRCILAKRPNESCSGRPRESGDP